MLFYMRKKIKLLHSGTKYELTDSGSRWINDFIVTIKMSHPCQVFHLPKCTECVVWHELPQTVNGGIIAVFRPKNSSRKPNFSTFIMHSMWRPWLCDSFTPEVRKSSSFLGFELFYWTFWDQFWILACRQRNAEVVAGEVRVRQKSSS